MLEISTQLLPINHYFCVNNRYDRRSDFTDLPNLLIDNYSSIDLVAAVYSIPSNQCSIPIRL